MESTTVGSIVDTAIFVHSDPFMKWMMPFRILTSLLGVVVIPFMMYHRKKFVAHFNLTFLLTIHVIFNLFTCILVAIQDAYIVYLQWTWRSGEDLVHTGYECYTWRAPPCLTAYGTMFSLIIISIERFLATVFYKNYEQCPKWLGVWFGFAEILIPCVCLAIGTAYYDFSERFSYCSVVSSSNFDAVMQITYFFLMSELLALVLFHISLFINWRRMKKRAIMDPTGRYQITENFKTIAAITPLIWFVMIFFVVSSEVIMCHFLIMIGSCVFFFAYMSFNPTFDPRSYPILEESANQIYWHGIILPLIFLVVYRYGSIRDQRVLELNGVGQESPSGVVIAKHEREIQKGW